MRRGEEARQLRVLIAVAFILCALIIGYSAFYVPDVSLQGYQAAAEAAKNVESGL